MTDKSDVILPSWLSEEEKSNTSILEMDPLKPAAPAESERSEPAAETASAPDGFLDDPGGVIAAPPASEEESIVLVLPGTRRETIQHPCFRHPETPAVVVCGRCARPICSLCGEDSPEGFVCSSLCSNPPRQRRGLVVALGATGVAAVLVAGVFLLRGVMDKDPSQAPPAPPREAARSSPQDVATAPVQSTRPEPPKLEPSPEAPKPAILAAPKSEPKPEPKPESPPEPKPEPKPPAPAALPAPRPTPPPAPSPKPELRPEVRPAPEPPRVQPPKPAPKAPEPPPPPSPLARAAGLIRESTPIFCDAADVIDEPVLRQIDRSAMLDRLKTARHNLEEARALYTEARGGAEDPAVLDRRIGILGHVLDAVPVVEERIQLSESMEKAARRIREATLLGREVTDATAAPPSEEIDRQALRLKAVLVREKLREARSIYIAVRGRAEDPGLIDSRIQKIDRILKIFEAR